MMQFIWFCASGDSFFLGAGLMALAGVLPIMWMVRVTHVFGRVLLVVGFALVMLAAIPFTLPFYLAWMVASVLSFAAPCGREKYRTIWNAGRAGVLVLCVAGVLSQPGSTIDLAHLSALGHERMADQVARLLGLAEMDGK
jgi:hypothetical protein